MGGRSLKSNAAKARKRVEADSEDIEQPSSTSLVRGKDGSAFVRCEECKKDVHVAIIGMHNCSLDAKIKSNLEAQVVEMQTETKKKVVEKKNNVSNEPKAKRQKKAKTEADKNKPKRPPTPFFIFLEEFRKEFKLAHPESKEVKRVAKEAGEKWKAMSDEDKKRFIEKATELKAQYKKALEGNNDEDNKNDDAELETVEEGEGSKLSEEKKDIEDEEETSDKS